MKKEDSNYIPWIYNGQMVIHERDSPSWAVGFVYRVTELNTGRIYIGKKNLSSKSRKLIGIREKKATATRKKFKTTIKSSNWLTYNTSNEEVRKGLESGNTDTWSKEILEFAFSKKNLTYLELEYQIKYDVLRNNSFNNCILSRFWIGDVVKPDNIWKM